MHPHLGNPQETFNKYHDPLPDLQSRYLHRLFLVLKELDSEESSLRGLHKVYARRRQVFELEFEVMALRLGVDASIETFTEHVEILLQGAFKHLFWLQHYSTEFKKYEKFRRVCGSLFRVAPSLQVADPNSTKLELPPEFRQPQKKSTFISGDVHDFISILTSPKAQEVFSVGSAHAVWQSLQGVQLSRVIRNLMSYNWEIFSQIQEPSMNKLLNEEVPVDVMECLMDNIVFRNFPERAQSFRDTIHDLALCAVALHYSWKDCRRMEDTLCDIIPQLLLFRKEVNSLIKN